MVEAAVTAGMGRLRALFALLLFPLTLSAHQLDEYLQATLVSIEPSEIRLEINLTPGVAIAGQVLERIDRNHDGAISPEEASAYVELLKRDLSVRLDGRDIPLHLRASSFPELEELRTGWGIIQLEFSMPIQKLASGPHKLNLENRHESKIGVYLLNAALPKDADIHITHQTRNDNQSVGEIDFFYRQASNPSRIWAIIAVSGVLTLALLAGARRVVKGSPLEASRTIG